MTKEDISERLQSIVREERKASSGMRYDDFLVNVLCKLCEEVADIVANELDKDAQHGTNFTI